MNNIRLHPKYGLNPTMPVCIICGKDKGEIALLGAAYPEQAPMHMLLDVEPCEDCRAKYLKEGVLLAERRIDHRQAPTGSFAVITIEAFKKIFDVPVPERHIAFVQEGVLDKIGALDAKKGEDHGKTR